MNPIVKDLISRLLVRDPNRRLGASVLGENGYGSLKSHEFFKGLDFNSLFIREGPSFKKKKNEDFEKNSDASSHTFFFLNEDFENILPSINKAMNLEEKDLKLPERDEFRIKSAGQSVLDTSPLLTGEVNYSVYLFFSRRLKMVLYGNGQVILFSQGLAKVPFSFKLNLKFALNQTDFIFVEKKHDCLPE
jgi:serine/threonine protein kinase